MDLLDRAAAHLSAGQIDESLNLAERCALDDSVSDALRLRARLLLASAHQQKGTAEPAMAAASGAIELARRLGDAGAEALALCVRASASIRLGLLQDAAEATARALSQARVSGHAGAEARALALMSNQALRRGDEAEARALLERSLQCARHGDDAEAEFWSLNNLSNLIGIQAARCAEAGERDAVQVLVAELVQVVEPAMAVARRTGHALQLAYAISNLADAFIVQGNHVRARELRDEYAAIARERGLSRLLAYANMDEVRMLRAEGRPEEAIAVIDCDAHRRLLPENDDIERSTEVALYELHKAAGRFEAALRHHEQVLALDTQRLTRRVDEMVRVMMARLEVEQARAAADRARLDAELNARRAQVLELEREQMHRAAHEDVLTGTGNRRAADEALRHRLGQPHAGVFVALVDVDHFKRINDRHGHAIGDAVLSALGALMRQALRSSDQVFRFGGEEFLLILDDTGPEAGREVCDRLRQAIQAHDWSAIAPGLSVTASFGLARRGEGDQAADQLVGRADQALYAAKRAGRNRVVAA